MQLIRRKPFLIAAVLLWSAVSAAGPCDGVFNFDGDLSDSGGDGNHGTMIGKGGKPATPVFVDGKFGQALQLDGTSAMRAPVDLYIKNCPQVTISAWIHVGTQSPKATQFLMSTGNPQGPGIRFSGTGMTLNGPGNGLHKANVLRPNAGWQFIAAIYDFKAGTYALHWQDREPELVAMGANIREWQDMFWVGAMDDLVSGPATGVLIDDVRITGSALSLQQLLRLKAGGPTQLPGDQFEPTQLPGDQFEPTQLPGDQFEPTQLPGDQFEPTQLPGDQFEPTQLPGDQFEPTEPSSGAAGIPASAAAATGVFNNDDILAATDDIIAGRTSQPPDLTPPADAGDSTQGGSIPAPADPPAPVRRPGPTGDRLFSGVAGYSGSNKKALFLADEFINAIDWEERSDHPCAIRVRAASAAETDVRLTGCTSGASVFGGGTTKSVELGAKTIIGNIQVCNNSNNNHRIKGLRIVGDHLNADGSTNYEPTASTAEHPNCSRWSPMTLCPIGSYATGLVVHSDDPSGNNGQIVGLQLICRVVGMK